MNGRFAGAVLRFAAVSAISTSFASAAWYEPFAYNDSASASAPSLGNGLNVNPQSNPNWFDGTTTQTNGNVWATNNANGTTTNDSDVAIGSLGYSGLHWTPTGNKVALQSTAADFNRIQVDQEYGAGSGGPTVFYSMLIRVSDMTGFTNTAAGGGFFTGLQFYPIGPVVADNMSSPSAGSAGPIVIRRADALNINAGYELGVAFRDAPNSNRIYGATDFTVADTLLAVVKMEFGSTAVGAEDDIATLWVFRDNGSIADPIPLTEPSTLSAHAQSANIDDDVTFDTFQAQTVNPLATSVRSIIMRGGSTSTPNGLELDELNVGNSWGQVVPEPTGLALLGVGALGMLRRRRK